MDIILGIIGGGQLGKMLLQYCSKISVKTYVYDPNMNCACKTMCEKLFQGSLMDYEKLVEFGRKCDILTYEIEHINIEALKKLEKEGICVYPSSSTLEVIQNKYTQKQFFIENNLPTTDFIYCENKEQIIEKIKEDKIRLPCVWKKTRFGYDGFGVYVIKSLNDMNNIPDCECIVEEYAEIEKEISLIVARNKNNEYESYDPVEMLFNKKSNQVEYVLQPASMTNENKDKMHEIGNELVRKFNYVGLLAIELFITKEGEILINELAPRPHNSGHLTIETNTTSQFEQHIRSILNLPLGITKFIEPSIMMNIVGEENYNGKAKYCGIEECFKMENTYLHVYGKEETRPNRKMGHVTIMGKGNLLNKARELKEKIKITSEI